MKIKLNDNISSYRLIRRIMQPLYILRLLVRNRRAKDIISALLLALSLALLGMTLFQRVDGAAGAANAAATVTTNEAAGASPLVTGQVSADVSSSSAEAATAISDTPSTAATQSEPLSIFGFKPVVIMSGSMEPALKTHALAIVRRTKDVKPGDMIMFRHGSTWVIHRYLADGPDGTIITKGDNNAAPDLMPVSHDSVYGRVVLPINILAPFIGKLQSLGQRMPLLRFPEAAYALPLKGQTVNSPDTESYTADIELNRQNQLTYTSTEHISFNALTPGDSRSYSVTTTNRTTQPVTYQLTGPVSEIGDTLLFEKLDLTISKGTAAPAHADAPLLYAGPLKDATFAPIRLAPGGSETLFYTFTFPADAGNEYQNRPVRAEFCYYAEADPAPKGHKTAEWTSDHSRRSPGSASPASGSGPSGIHLYPTPAVTDPALTDGEWILVDAERHIWNYRVGAELVRGGWIAVRNPYSQTDATGHHWFYFYEDGQMAYGWLKLPLEDTSDSAAQSAPITWYFLHEVSDGDLGTLVTGWHEDRDDGYTYYLDPATGEMVHGWHTINGSDYYFAEQSEIAGLNWFLRKAEAPDQTHIFGWFFRNFHRRTYGSMYRDELTPDGSYVARDGKRAALGPASARSVQSGGAS